MSFDMVVIENKKNENFTTIILYNKIYKFTFIGNKKAINIDMELYCIRIKYNIFIENIFSYKQINKFLRTFEFYFFIKIKFKGKGFKIKFNKKIKLIKFWFGRSHITFYKLRKIKLKKITKYKFLLRNFNLPELNRIASRITYVKPVNVYTLRGIRVSRQYISKRKGKKSSYV